MSGDKLMSHFINNLFDPTLENFIIARMCRTFAEACTMVMMFEDSMLGLQVSTHVDKQQTTMKARLSLCLQYLSRFELLI